MITSVDIVKLFQLAQASALAKLKRNKTEGTDRIVIKMLAALDKITDVNEIYNCRIYNCGDIPET